MDEQRKPLSVIVEQTNEILGALVNKLVSTAPNETILSMIYLICKIFYAANQFEVSPFYSQN